MLEERDGDAPGAVIASDGRTWPSLRAALDSLAAEGWRLVSVIADSRGLVRSTLRRPRP